jgi:hypothetical protein
MHTQDASQREGIVCLSGFYMVRRPALRLIVSGFYMVRRPARLLIDSDSFVD